MHFCVNSAINEKIISSVISQLYIFTEEYTAVLPLCSLHCCIVAQFLNNNHIFRSIFCFNLNIVSIIKFLINTILSIFVAFYNYKTILTIFLTFFHFGKMFIEFFVSFVNIFLFSTANANTRN